MSWSVNAAGTPAEVRGQLSEQFKYPLAEKPAGLDDDGERATVALIGDLLEQITTTYDAETKLAVAAYGHMSFDDYATRTGARQSVSFTVTPQG
jgi:hypothetical protein